MFITFEGIGGCGKTTQITGLAERLKQVGYEVIRTREPGGSPGAEEIRSLILSGETEKWSAETEILLFNAARLDHLERVILPAIKSGKIVVCDRFVDSTRAYQGVARADLRKVVDSLHDLMIGRESDLTLVIDISPEVGQERMNRRASDEEDRFDKMGIPFQTKLRDAYLEIAQEFPERCVVISGMGTPEEVFARVWAAVEPRL